MRDGLVQVLVFIHTTDSARSILCRSHLLIGRQRIIEKSIGSRSIGNWDWTEELESSPSLTVVVMIAFVSVSIGVTFWPTIIGGADVAWFNVDKTDDTEVEFIINTVFNGFNLLVVEVFVVKWWLLLLLLRMVIMLGWLLLLWWLLIDVWSWLMWLICLLLVLLLLLLFAAILLGWSILYVVALVVADAPPIKSSWLLQ